MSRPGRTSFSLSSVEARNWDKPKLVLPTEKMLGRARPRPQFGLAHKPRPHGVVVDIAQNPFVLSRVSYPVIKRFVLPKGDARPVEHPIGETSRDALDPTGHSSGGFRRHREEMHMVGHDRVSAELAYTISFRLADYIANHAGYTCVAQPNRSMLPPVKLPVYRHERSASVAGFSRTSFSLSFSLLSGQAEACPTFRTGQAEACPTFRTGQAEACPTALANSRRQRILWQRSCEPPGDEQPAFVGVPMRKMAAIVGHKTGQAEACPTGSGARGENSQGGIDL
jgi:hypothetical protein